MSQNRPALMGRAFFLEWCTLTWNVVGVFVLAVAAWRARSVALAGFGLDSLVEIGASTVVLWELAGSNEERTRRALRLLGVAFLLIALYLLIQGIVALASHHQAQHSSVGILWTALTAGAMFTLARTKSMVGRALKNPAVLAEARVTFIDGVLAASVLLGLALNALFNWWWADPAAGFVITYYALREVREVRRALVAP